MPDPRFALAAISAGAFCAGAVLVIGYEHLAADLSDRLAQPPVRLGAVLHIAGLRGRLALSIERAGWNESPERVAVLAIVLAMCLGLVGATVSVALAVLGFIGGCGAFVVTLNAAIVQRRRR